MRITKYVCDRCGKEMTKSWQNGDKMYSQNYCRTVENILDLYQDDPHDFEELKIRLQEGLKITKSNLKQELTEEYIDVISPIEINYTAFWRSKTETFYLCPECRKKLKSWLKGKEEL